MNKQFTATITGIDADVWTPIRYPQAIWEAEEQRWVSDAEVAEVPITIFTSQRKHEHVTCRLVVRGVKRLNPTSSRKDGQRSVQEE